MIVTDEISKTHNKLGINKGGFLDLKSTFDPSNEQELFFQESVENLGVKFHSTHRIANSINAFLHPPDQLKHLDKKLTVSEYLKFIEKFVVDGASRSSSPFRIAHMSGPLPFYSKHLSFLLTTLNQNLVAAQGSASLTVIEKETIAELHKDFYGGEFERRFEDCYGIVTSCGSVANETAIWIALNKCFPPSPQFKGLKREGLWKAMKEFSYNGVAIIGSRMAHYSIQTAAALTGIGEENFVAIDTDSNFKIDTDMLRRKVAELKSANVAIVAIIGIAGTTETGSIDDLEEIGNIAIENEVHFHVDACWGAPFIYSPRLKNLFKGIEKADTISIDGHKQFHTPYGLGMVLFKDVNQSQHIKKSSQYAIRDSVDLGQKSFEGSRPGNILYLHANLLLLGKEGIKASIENNYNNSKKFVNYLKSFNSLDKNVFQIFNENNNDTNIIVYRIIPKPLGKKKFNELNKNDNISINEFNINLEKIQTTTGRCFTSRTVLKINDTLITALRVVFINSVLCNEDDLKTVVNEQLLISQKLELEFSSVNN
ncbi:hypothetical protein HDU92_008576 [Lobulomyces angularis]|nr:hypothetical protein HDU92_008576 [Lobulomyces angularis]